MPKLVRLVLRSLALSAAAVTLSAAAPRRAGAQASFVVVVNVTNSASNIARSELAALFTKKEQSWSDGTPAFPVDLPDDDPVREAFTQAIHGKSPRAIRAYWQQQIFSGRQVPPPERDSDDQVLAYVRATVGAVGYVRSTARLGPGVKVLGLIAR
jgi:ABC-type phosphate transport system substrate-binding protein